MSRSASMVVVLAVACMAATASAAAQQLPRARFGLGAGATMPRGEFHSDALGEGFKAGWQGMIFLEFRAPEKPLGVRVDVVFGSNAANDQWNTASGTSDKLRMLGANADVIYSFLRSAQGISAYALAGAGTYRLTLSSTSAGITTDDSENKFGWNAGAGATYPMGGLSLFLEARYNSIATTIVSSDKLPFIGLVAGVRFGGN